MTTLIRVGNSLGVRIPKALIEQAHLKGKNLVFKVIDEGLLIRPVKQPRQGWKEQFDQALQSGNSDNANQEWLDAPLSADEDWEW